MPLAEGGGDAALAPAAAQPRGGAGGWRELEAPTPYRDRRAALSALGDLAGIKLGWCLRCQCLDQRMKLCDLSGCCHRGCAEGAPQGLLGPEVRFLFFFYPEGTTSKERAASTAPTATGFLLEEPSRVLWGWKAPALPATISVSGCASPVSNGADAGMCNGPVGLEKGLPGQRL